MDWDVGCSAIRGVKILSPLLTVVEMEVVEMEVVEMEVVEMGIELDVSDVVGDVGVGSIG
jgi:hypothetical protein